MECDAHSVGFPPHPPHSLHPLPPNPSTPAVNASKIIPIHKLTVHPLYQVSLESLKLTVDTKYHR